MVQIARARGGDCDGGRVTKRKGTEMRSQRGKVKGAYRVINI